MLLHDPDQIVYGVGIHDPGPDGLQQSLLDRVDFHSELVRANAGALFSMEPTAITALTTLGIAGHHDQRPTAHAALENPREQRRSA